MTAPDPAGVLDPSRALVPATVKVNERKVRRGLLPKLASVAARIPFASEVAAVYFSARDPATPAPAKGMMLAGLAYFILPTDALPDIIAGIGFTDDAAVIAALLAVVGRVVKPQHREAAADLLTRMRGDA